MRSVTEEVSSPMTTMSSPQQRQPMDSGWSVTCFVVTHAGSTWSRLRREPFFFFSVSSGGGSAGSAAALSLRTERSTPGSASSCVVSRSLLSPKRARSCRSHS